MVGSRDLTRSSTCDGLAPNVPVQDVPSQKYHVQEMYLPNRIIPLVFNQSQDLTIGWFMAGPQKIMNVVLTIGWLVASRGNKPLMNLLQMMKILNSQLAQWL